MSPAASPTVFLIPRFADVLDPVIEFLGRERDLFARPRIVVPNAGAKAWLRNELAGRLGAGGDRDGIVAGVEFAYPGAIVTMLTDQLTAAAWAFDRLTFAVLDVIAADAGATLGIPGDASRGPLLTARRIAGLLDNYHVRRPAMIERWESGQPVQSPVATGARSMDGQWAADALAADDIWQFRVWRAVRERIGVPCPSARLPGNTTRNAAPLLVVGLESFSLLQITCLERLAALGDVTVLFVHPAPPLAERWTAALPAVSPGVPPPREQPELPADLDPLVATWIHGARETQSLLASQGIRPRSLDTASQTALPAAVLQAGTTPPVTGPLLHRMQWSITSAEKPTPQPHRGAEDRSFAIHRCHSLARQAEVLHDAILHAFRELPDLEPHEVAVVSPCLPALAPHLEAVFDREIRGRDGRHVRLPLVVADRGLHEVSDAAQLLVDLLALTGSRCSVEQLRTVATHPLVREHFHVDEEMIACWDRLVDRSRIHWGFDAEHRARVEFPAEAAEPHTWRAGLERMLLGALVPDVASQVSVAGVVPLPDVPLASIPAIGTLIRIFDVVRALDSACSQPRPTGDWCLAIEGALFGLCGTEAVALAEPLGVVRQLAAAASATPVPFTDVRSLLAESLAATVGRQPLRTGAITATSMVPLRGVPFRVICVAGYDDGAVGAPETQGDDLASRQSLAGDGDPRIDARRVLLDALMAARDRLVITCTGMNIKNNEPLPLVTPLAELVDFAVRHGVDRADASEPSGVEIRHPRHAVGLRNFLAGEVQPGVTWSHDASALAAARAVGGDAAPIATVPAPLPSLPVVELALLEEMVRDPLGLYLRRTLVVPRRRDDEEFPPATFPLAMTGRDHRDLAGELLAMLVTESGSEADWLAAAQASGRVPFGRFGAEAIEEIRQLVRGFITEAAAGRKPVPLTGFSTLPVRIQLPGRLVSGHLANVHPATNLLVDIRVTKGKRDSWGLPLHVAALRLLVAQAAGLDPEAAVVVARHENWEPNHPGPTMIQRSVRLADGLRTRDAAAQRLAEICDLLPRALAAPCGRFGGVAAKVVEKVTAGDVGSARQAFTSYTAFRHPGTEEELVYGEAPVFDDVLGPDSHEFAFHADFERLFTITGRYVLS